MNWHFETYSLEQWIILFFIYAFLGYIWEVAYVSVKTQKLTDRGFLYGPIVPIYGTGALIVLLATIPFRENLWLVFFCGMLAATVLEYVTGWVMEKLFAVRYWDYSEEFLNLNGYICLKASLAWGVFSVILLSIGQTWVEKILFLFSENILTPLAFVLVIIFSVDVTRSVRAALDLKDVLRKLAENNEELRRLKKRFDVLAAVAAEDKENFKERLSLEKENFAQKVEELKEERDLLREKHKTMRREYLQKAIDERRVQVEEMLSSIKAKEKYWALAGTENKEELLGELGRIKERIEEIVSQRIAVKEERSFKAAQRILRRNQAAVSKAYAEALEELLQLRNKKKS